MADRQPRPTFIGGTGKCGTSVAKRCLWRHPEVSSQADELHWLWTFQTDRPGFDDRYFAIDRVNEVIFNAGGRIYVDDSPESIFGAHLLDAQFGVPRLIHMIRHPLDVLDALQSERSPGTYWGTNVKQNARRIRWVHENAPQRSLTVRLEDLVKGPADQLTRICDHVDIDYHEDMKAPIDPTRPKVGRRQNLDARELETVMPLLRPVMDRYGYRA